MNGWRLLFKSYSVMWFIGCGLWLWVFCHSGNPTQAGLAVAYLGTGLWMFYHGDEV